MNEERYYQHANKRYQSPECHCSNVWLKYHDAVVCYLGAHEYTYWLPSASEAVKLIVATSSRFISQLLFLTLEIKKLNFIAMQDVYSDLY